jgi:hypothetical protein
VFEKGLMMNWIILELHLSKQEMKTIRIQRTTSHPSL